ncbi:MAG: class I SAM-dependent methyltransferase [Pyrinomonadaceae bacterium]
MERMYRPQKYFYDLTRKYYLLGRDQLLDKMQISGEDSVLEVGCGTGRNLVIAARRYPNASFYGIDASDAMLESSFKKIKKFTIKNVMVKKALADDYSFAKTFYLAQKFDVIYFSFSISMIENWQAAIKNAIRNLKSGGIIYFVDFFDQRHLSPSFRKLLTIWLGAFHVKYPSGFEAFLSELESAGLGKQKITPIFKSYSFIAEFKTRTQS